MRKVLLFVLALWTISRVVLLPTLAEGFDLRAHDAMSLRAVAESGLDGYLKDQLGLREGTSTVISNSSTSRTIELWIRLGSQLEDSSVRPLHHFHNPTRTWDQAGLRVTDIQTGQSAVLWGQERHQAPGGQHSWHDARTSFLRALTTETDVARQGAYAETFQSLGHLLHLLQDTAVPAHTRNDPHLVLFGIGDQERFEAWAEEAQSLNIILAGPRWRFDPSILALPPNPLAPVPIARILDTERYRQTGVPEAGTNIGLAEYSSANFFSDDTIFSGLPFPRESSVDLSPTVETNANGRPRRYFVKIQDGEVGYRIAVPSVLYGTLQAAFSDQWKELDDLVFEDYARLLFSRAVGYGAGLLEYFFRGTLDFEVKLDATDPTQREIRITNTSTEAMDGAFTIYAEDASGIRSPVVTFPLNLPSGTGSEPLTFTPPPGVRAYALVFQGTLGAEEGAVAGTVKPWELSYIFLVQEVVEFTGDAVRTEAVWEDSPTRFSASSFLTKRPGKQRAAGRFVFPGEPLPGSYLQAVRVSSRPEVRLRLNGIDVGPSWSPATGPILVPVTWEVQVDIPDDNLAKLPRDLSLVMLDGTTWRPPLIWWRSGRTEAGAEGRFQADCGGDPRECWEMTSSDSTVEVGVFFGDGDQNGFERKTGPLNGNYPLSAEQTSVSFTPTLGVEGFPVGTALVLFSDTFDRPPSPFSCGAGSASNDFITIFARIYTTPTGEKFPVWRKNDAEVVHIRADAVRKAFGTCSKPQVPQPSAPSLPELRFRRDYNPSEQEVFQRFNITPPQYEIRLR